MTILANIKRHPTVLRYYGAKNGVSHSFAGLLTCLLKKLGQTQLLSGFAGGLSSEQTVASKGYSVLVSEKDEDIFCFWDCIKNRKVELKTELYRFIEQKCESYPMRSNNTKFFMPRKDIPCQYLLNMFRSPNPAVHAAAVFAYNRNSFNGDMTNRGIGRISIGIKDRRFTSNSIKTLLSCDMRNITIVHADWSLVASNQGLFYGDPPYPGVGNLYNFHSAFDHLKLYEAMKQRGQFVLSYNDLEEIRERYRDIAYPVQVEWPKYSGGSTGGDGRQIKDNNKELVIISKDLVPNGEVAESMVRDIFTAASGASLQSTTSG